MRFIRALLFVLPVLSAAAAAQDGKQKHSYQSDVARMRKIVIESLYSHRDVFLRELISNANDALEKLRITSLTDKTVYDGVSPLNITVKLVKDEEGSGGRVIISDTGIGMTVEELTKNLGTLAKSGTSEFLAKAESAKTGGDNGNLIGAFGLGFYSSFLVADNVQVASIPPPSKANPNPVQHIFSSGADDSTFEIFADPRGNTLGRGTEITLHLKDDAFEFLEVEKIKDLVHKHSAFATTFPIYLFTQKTEEVPIPADELPEEPVAELTEAAAEEPKPTTPTDDEEATVEDSADEEKKVEDVKEKPVPMKTVTTDEWVQLNGQAPIWTRDPKEVTDEEYKDFYKATFKDLAEPLAWTHFKGDSGTGVSFKAIIYVPANVPPEFWQSAKVLESDVRLMVKRVFITKDLGADALPKWVSWLKVVVDADDLPLNVSRENLQSNKFLKQMKQMIIKRFIQLLSRTAEDDDEKYRKILDVFNPVIKLGALEAEKDKVKLAALARFDTTQRNFTSLDQYLENRKTGQKQIFYLAGLGSTPEDLAKSIFVEKLHARGYEVLLLTDPMDEMLMQNVRKWQGLNFQDVAKKGLKYGDEDEEAEKEEAKEVAETYKPLIDWLKEQTKNIVMDVIISNRLVASPCAIVADTYGYSANMEKLMGAQNVKKDNYMYEYGKKQKALEINPHSPLIQGLLRRVNALEDGEDKEAEDELKEVASILIDGALVRSGFEVPDSNKFFTRVDRVLRRSLGVSETAKADVEIKPAPPVDSTIPVMDDRVEVGDEQVVNLGGQGAGDPELEAMIEKLQQEEAAQNAAKAQETTEEVPVAEVKAEEEEAAAKAHDEL